MKKRQFPGTDHRRSWDVNRVAAALAAPGIDPRMWVSYGTVGILDDEGNLNVTDKRAVYVGPEGVEVDVLLEPCRVPVTAKYAGIQGGASVFMMAPIKPGDLVLVTLPNGDASVQPVIVAVMNSGSVKVPIGADQKPIFKNDRVLLWAKDVDVEVVPGSGKSVKLGSVTDGDLDAVALATDLKSFLEDFKSKYDAHQHPSVSSGPITPTDKAPTVPGIAASNVKAKK